MQSEVGETERQRDKEAEEQINSRVFFFLHRNDEIWSKQIWCIIIAVLRSFLWLPCEGASCPCVLLTLCVLNVPLPPKVL